MKRIYIPLPDGNGRRLLLKHRLKGQSFSLPSKKEVLVKFPWDISLKNLLLYCKYFMFSNTTACPFLLFSRKCVYNTKKKLFDSINIVKSAKWLKEVVNFYVSLWVEIMVVSSDLPNIKYSTVLTLYCKAIGWWSYGIGQFAC